MQPKYNLRKKSCEIIYERNFESNGIDVFFNDVMYFFTLLTFIILKIYFIRKKILGCKLRME